MASKKKVKTASRTLEEQIDKALDLVELPPIRVPTAIHKTIEGFAASRGVVLQKEVRDLIVLGLMTRLAEQYQK